MSSNNGQGLQIVQNTIFEFDELVSNLLRDVGRVLLDIY